MRTWLFAPGHEERKVGKALASSAECVILDWEDAVPAEQKDAARESTVAALAGLAPERLSRVVVRVNHPSSPQFSDDLEALEGYALLAIMLPKVESVAEVEAAAEADLSLVLLLESARGIARADDLAACHERVRYLGFGPLDLLADIGGQWSPGSEETLYARSRVPIAARAARLVGALDGPWPPLRDLDGLRTDTALGRRLGYVGRLLIHPAQIDVVREVYAPSEEELDFARRTLAAASAARLEGRGAIAVDGRFVDPPVLRWAERIVAEAEEQ